MTPAVEALTAANVVFETLSYGHDPQAASYGDEVIAALGLAPPSVFKTLVADTGDGLVVAIVPVAARLDLKALARAAGTKRAALAEPAVAERATGYVVGGISPFGQRRSLPTVLDRSAMDQPTIHVSGGRRGLEIAIGPQDLVTITDATVADVAADR
ncbi:MAG: Cys-tRNA(Pro) deacylase [Acidimicrobiia bacterium]|nr:Cys-tRNA(Pro) deacylase [Acidimicrobiia bacterium]